MAGALEGWRLQEFRGLVLVWYEAVGIEELRVRGD